jgi:hypothetical protein
VLPETISWEPTLVDPFQKQVTVYAPEHVSERISSDSVEGSGPVAGFTLNLARVWRFYET